MRANAARFATARASAIETAEQDFNLGSLRAVDSWQQRSAVDGVLKDTQNAGDMRAAQWQRFNRPLTR